jgi:hypothetical protein
MGSSLVTAARRGIAVATLYRIVKSDPPTERDFLSFKALGRPLLRGTPSQRRSWEGVSVTSTLEAARALAARAPSLGRFIAVLELDEDGPIRFAPIGRAPEHYDLWGEPEEILATVVRVVPV